MNTNQHPISELLNCTVQINENDTNDHICQITTNNNVSILIHSYLKTIGVETQLINPDKVLTIGKPQQWIRSILNTTSNNDIYNILHKLKEDDELKQYATKNILGYCTISHENNTYKVHSPYDCSALLVAIALQKQNIHALMTRDNLYTISHEFTVTDTVELEEAYMNITDDDIYYALSKLLKSEIMTTCWIEGQNDIDYTYTRLGYDDFIAGYI